MFKRLSTVLMLGGLLGLVPTAAAQAAPAAPARAVQADQAGTTGYDLFHHGDDDDHYRCMYRCGERHRYNRDHRGRYHKQRYCWYHDRWGWYQARCRGYDSHRHHPH